MDRVTRELDDLITVNEFDDRMTDVACYDKIKIDYLLMLTIAAAWDMKKNAMDMDRCKAVLSYLQRPETGKLIRLLDSGLRVDKKIADTFNLYKEGRNLRFGHTTFEEYVARHFKAECDECYNSLMQLEPIEDADSDRIRKLYQKENDYYYVSRIKQNGEMLVNQLGRAKKIVVFPKIDMKARLVNRDDEIKEGDLFILVEDKYIKVSPFILYNDKEDLFMMLMDIEESLAFKMAYVYRTKYANDSEIYLGDFPEELKEYFPEAVKKLGRNGISINRFSQYELFEQEYYKGIHEDIQHKLDKFITGNMAFGAVRGVGGVGKTSTVFMWMNRILNNEEGILDNIRAGFNLRNIIFLSAKTKIYSRELNEENLSSFYDIESDVRDYDDIVNVVYAVFHPSEKQGITFEDKEKWLKGYAVYTKAILIIIDDFESLPDSSMEKIKLLKDDLDPKAVKMLITTRFVSKESKDIIVERLEEDDCAKMTDHIFGNTKWRADITTKEMHRLTGGLPLLIWYAKAYFKMGQLSTDRLKSSFSGPAEGLDSYLFDNFVQCFEDEFTKNFLMIVSRYYELYNELRISKKIAIFLCLKNLKEYKKEDEEFYFQELIDLKLISINQSTGAIDYSPLMTFMDKSKKKPDPKEEYQEDALKVLEHLDEKAYQGLYAVIESAEYMGDEEKCRMLNRVVEFSQKDDKVRVMAINKIFAITQDKMKLYEANIPIFRKERVLINSMIEYLMKKREVIPQKFDVIRDFVKTISVSIESQDESEMIAYKGLKLIQAMLLSSLDERDGGEITNSELSARTDFLHGIAMDFKKHLQDTDKCSGIWNSIDETLKDIDVYIK